MGILIVTIIFIGLSFLWVYKSISKISNFNDFPIYIFIICVTALAIELFAVGFKHCDYRTFERKYNLAQISISQCQEIKEYALIENITDINQTIEYYKEFSNNPMTNIFFSKDIANMELLPYSK